MAQNGNGEFSFGNTARNGLAKIQTNKKQSEAYQYDAAPTVKVQTIDELHSLQRKRSAPTTPIKTSENTFAAVTEEERQKQQLQSIRYNYHRHH